jgi:outer membrane lipoprotein-sorting protein
MRRLSSRARWAVPAGAVAVVGIVVAATAVASASEPSLPARTPVQLLTEVQQAAARPLSPQTATIQETANLGIPALPQVGAISGESGPDSTLNLLAGTTTIDLWYLNPTHLRIAEPTQMGESDLRLDGTRLWLWDSKTQTATHVLLPAQAAPGSHKLAPRPVPRAAIGSPAAVARRLLANLGPSTSVTVGPNATVAGRPAYQLVIAPKTSGSLIGQVVIAIDASSHLPLRVQVFARGSSSPAFQVGYTALSFGAPAASNFTFTPPPGAKVKTITVPDKVPGELGPASLGAAGILGPLVTQRSAVTLSPPGPAGSGSVTYVGGTGQPVTLHSSAEPPALPPALPPAVARQVRAAFVAHLPKNLTKAQRAAAIRTFSVKIAAREAGKGGSTGYAPMTTQPSLGSGSPRVLGSGWTSVVATPASPLVAQAMRGLLAAPVGGGAPQSAGPFGGSSSQAAPGQAGPGQAEAIKTGPVAVGPYLAVLRALLRASTPVSGSWGSGRLLRTALLTVLVTSKGQILAGAVTPSVLYGDVAALSR